RIPVNLITGPDSVIIELASSNLSEPITLDRVGSTFLVDNLEFQSQAIPTATKPLLLADNTLLIYPNPAATQFSISSTLGSINEVRLQNVLGETVVDNNYAEGNASDKQHIDVSQLPNGIYFISITSGNKMSTGKIEVNR